MRFHISPFDTIKRMKKLSLLYTLAAVAALASCQSKESVSETEKPILHIPTGFRATLPGDSGAKTTVDMATGIITWIADDPIFVSNGSDYMTMYVEEGGSTYAELYAGEEVFEGNNFYAVYPAANAAYSNGIFQTAIPTTQNYVKGGFDTQTFPMVAICDNSRNFAFRNAASLLEIRPVSALFEDVTITSVTLTAEEPICGEISVSYTSGGEPVVDCSTGEKSVTVTGPEGGIPFGEPIYVAVAPGDYDNLHIKVSLSNGLSQSYDCQANVSVNRSAYRRVDVTLEDNFLDLSADETSNCYVITVPGYYKFKAGVRGNGVGTSRSVERGIAPDIEGIAEVKMYYNDGGNFVDGSFALHEGYIYFSTTEGVLPIGTALLSVLDEDGNTLWSWHIWSNPRIADVPLSDGSVWLNMNLGAHQVGFNKDGYNGYYYQWGRKDPFLQKYTADTKSGTLAPFVSHASSTDGSLENSIANPHIFYGGYHPAGVTEITEDWSTYEDDDKVYDWWNKNITGDGQTSAEAAKTMFDPCPPGYHVPVHSDIESLLTLAKANIVYSTSGRTIEGSLYFPYTSYRYIAINTNWWPGGSEASRIFIPSSTPMVTGSKTERRYSRMYMTSSPSQGITNAQRSYAVPVRCIKDGSSAPVVIPVESVSLNRSALEIIAGGVYTLVAEVLPENATDKTLTWESSDTGVATVTEGGVVTAVAEGTATITVSASGKSATCVVTVKRAGGGYEGGIEEFDPDEWK